MLSNNTLSVLTEEQLADLYDLLSSETIASVQRRLLEPPPIGHNLKVHRNTLSRFYRERSRHERAAVIADLELLPENPAHVPALFESSHAALAHYTYTQASGPIDRDAYNSMCRAIQRYHATTLRNGFLEVARQQAAIARERLDLDRELLAEKKRQFNFNAARVAAFHAAKIHKVIEMQGPDAEDKTWMVSEIIFGPSPNKPAVADSSRSLGPP